MLGVREGDGETAAFLAARAADCRLPITIATAREPGVIASMAAAAARTDGDLVCLLDDDAEPEPDWLARIEARFAAEPRLGVLGGRDLLQDQPAMRLAEPTTERVGQFPWYGRLVGNHHRGAGGYRHTRIVKGCNAAIRGELLRAIGFEGRLRGQGAQVHWELALCLDVANAGYAVGYDPAIRVLHHVAPRHDHDLTHRGVFSPHGLFDMVWNERFIVATRCGAARRSTHLAWAVLVGTKTAPGALQYLRLLREGDANRAAKLKTTMRALWEGNREGSRAATASPSSPSSGRPHPSVMP